MYRISSIVPKPIKRSLSAMLNSIGVEIRIHRPSSKPHPIEIEWAEVQAGPLRGVQLLLNKSQSEFKDGSYDAFVFRELERQELTLAGATVWDVGAYIGYHTLAFSTLVGSNGQVVAFEPNPQNVSRLKANAEKNPSLTNRIRVEQLALSDVDGPQAFRFEPGGVSSIGFLSRGGPPSDRIPAERYSKCELMEVHSARADTLIEQREFATPTLVKIDVEGAESAVLHGALNLLTYHRPLLFIEIHNVTAMFEIQQLLYQLDYSLRLLDPQHTSSSRCFVVAQPSMGDF